MNPAFLAQIASLLGQPTGTAAPGVAPNAPNTPLPPAADAAAPDIQIQSSHIDPSQYKDRQGLLANILPGVFKMGSTGGNILGSLKDAFLIQSGHDPIYAPRLYQAREAEALKNYSSDPQTAVDQLSQVNPNAALHQYDVLNDNQRQQAAEVDRHQAFKDQYENNTKQRALSLISSATDQPSLDAAVKRAKDYYAARGQTPDFDMPTTYTPEAIKALRNVGIPVEAQTKLEDADAYKQAVLALNTQKAQSNQAYRSARLKQIDTGLGYMGQKTDHTVNAPQTPNQLKGVLAAKIAAGQQFTPAEQKAWTMLNPPKAGKSGPAVQAVRNADGSYTFKRN